MKRKIIVGFLAVVLIFGGAMFANAKISDKDAADSTNAIVSEENVTNSEIKDSKKVDIISKDEVKNAVLEEVNGKIESIELEKESGKIYYEVEVENADFEYEFYVDAKTGDTFLVEKEARDDDKYGDDRYDDDRDDKYDDDDDDD